MSNTRLNPPFYNDRYYHLTSLRDTLKTIIKRHITHGKHDILIDFGCGSMPYKTLFTPFVKSYMGADIGDNNSADIHIDKDGRAPLCDNCAGIVLSTQVLEHVQSPKQYLYEAHRLLKPGGLLILSTHGFWMYHPDPHDFWRWTKQGLNKVIVDAGFNIIESKSVMNLASSGLQLFQDGSIRLVPRFIRGIYSAAMQLLICLADKISSHKSGCEDASVFVIIAQKNDTACLRHSSH